MKLLRWGRAQMDAWWAEVYEAPRWALATVLALEAVGAAAGIWVGSRWF